MTLKINRMIRTGITKLTQPRLESWEGVAGNGAGTVIIPGTNDEFMYARPVGSNIPVKVRVGSAPVTEGTHIWIGPDFGNNSRAMRVQGVTTTTPGIASVQAHASTHFINGTDPLWMDLAQIVNLLATPDGMTVTVKAGWVIVAGKAVWCEKQTLTFTAPGTGALYSLIRANSAGVLSSQDGTPVDAFVDLLKTDIPTVATGYAALWAVRLYAGQTAVSWTTAASDLVDLRFATQAYGGSAASAPAFATTRQALGGDYTLTATNYEEIGLDVDITTTKSNEIVLASVMGYGVHLATHSTFLRLYLDTVGTGPEVEVSANGGYSIPVTVFLPIQITTPGSHNISLRMKVDTSTTTVKAAAEISATQV